jgi:NADH-quinone oxidoreductase subunit J
MFWVLAVIVLGFGVVVVRARNLFKAALSLAFCLFGVAGIYLLLQAEFLAGVQVLIYVGAVATLILFAVMVTRGMGDPQLKQFNEQQLPGAIVALTALLAIGLALVNGVLLAAPLVGAADGSVLGIGTELLMQYVLPFDVVTVLLLISMVGSIILARKE